MKHITVCMMLLCLGLVPLKAQELKGPTQIVPGTLAVFEISPPQIASWIVTPSDSGNLTFAVDSGSARMYFATSNKGTYTIVAAIICDDHPHQLTATLINDSGEPDPPNPEPIPVPNKDLAQWLAKEIPTLVKSKNIESEKTLIGRCFKRISESIDQGVIQTASNARTQLQISLTAALAKASPTAVTDWQEFLVALSKKMQEQLSDNNDSLPDLKKLLFELSNLFMSPLQDITPTKEETKVINKSAAQTVLETVNQDPNAINTQTITVPGTKVSSCENGQCTTPQSFYLFRR